MINCQYDVIVVGAGAAGLTAAIGLARSGFSVAIVESAPFPGAENWSGCVYFCESLAHPEILGPDGVEELAWERRLIERGFFSTDGHGIIGLTYRDPSAFRNCYTVLRPIYDHHMGIMAQQFGATLLSGTTAESLLRDRDRVIGIATNRGALYADVVFLAEGDASHLVTREGYERFTDPKQKPTFLQGIKQVITLPEGEIERRFGVGREEGVAYEMLVRNGNLRGNSVQLNAGGFLYTNHNSLSIGLVLPANNLYDHFEGDPNLLMEWFSQLPSLQPWFRDCKQEAFGAKLIRGGGSREIPTLVDDGLAIGGAATAIGVDFPYPNFTGPATAMGLLFAQAVKRINAEKQSFTKENLQQYYVEPLKQHRYWKDVDFLRRWPDYIKKTKVFFGSNVDLTLKTAYVWTRPHQSAIQRWSSWLRMLIDARSKISIAELQTDSENLRTALRLDDIAPRLAFWQLILDGSINAMRDLLRIPRANLPTAGEVKLHYSIANEALDTNAPPSNMVRWFRRFAPVLASASRLVYCNDDIPLTQKLPRAMELLLKQINLLDVSAVAALGLLGSLHASVVMGWRRLLKKQTTSSSEMEMLSAYANKSSQAIDMTPHLANSTRAWEERLSKLAYITDDQSHIHLDWPLSLADRDGITKNGLWHVCPAHVYEARRSETGQLQLVVNYENCIKCETCWRTSDVVDWARDGEQQFVYAVSSPAVQKVLLAQQSLGLPALIPPKRLFPWKNFAGITMSAVDVEQFLFYCDQLDRKLLEFDQALKEEPRTIDASRNDYLLMLARYAHQLASKMHETVKRLSMPDSNFVQLVLSLVQKTEERTNLVWNRQYAWAAADGRQIRFHHLTGLRHWLLGTGERAASKDVPGKRFQKWLKTERRQERNSDAPAQWQDFVADSIPRQLWRTLEHSKNPPTDITEHLLEIVQAIPKIQNAEMANTLQPPLRKWLLGRLAYRDPSLAFCVAHHLWARDIIEMAVEDKSALAIQNDNACLCLAIPDKEGFAYFVPTLLATHLVVLRDKSLIIQPIGKTSSAVTMEPSATLGLRGAKLVKVKIEENSFSDATGSVDQEMARNTFVIQSSVDLIAIATGMAELLCERAIEQATGRVQFPGLFHDEENRDAIGKFGAVKKMVAEIAAKKYCLETMNDCLSPVALDDANAEQCSLLKALAAELLGTAPGSITYNAVQVFGGTGYSEDDCLSKYYRDASAWHFLGVANVNVFQERGEVLLTNWNAVTEPLSTLPGESEIFDEVFQRKALQAELDEIRVHRSRVRKQTAEWLSAHDNHDLATNTIDNEFQERLGRQDAYLLASKAVLLRTHSRLENGIYSELETALLRIWLETSADVLNHFEDAVHRRIQFASLITPRPVVDPSLDSPPVTYADYLKSNSEYQSGDFLCRTIDPARPQFVPEMIERDPSLNEQNTEIRARIMDHFGEKRHGLGYERYIEKQHRPDASDLDFLRRNGYFRMPIPKEFGGEGASKARYYFLTTATHQLADVAISLTIQVNSSLGTTPVLLARNQDLPKAEKELSSFANDTELHGKVESALQTLASLDPERDAGKTKQSFNQLNQMLGERFLRYSSLRILGFTFAQQMQAVGLALKKYDWNSFPDSVKQAQSQWSEVCRQVPSYTDEVKRRRQACDLFLHWVASGQISAFALTEPSAGSDTARVVTKAQRRSVPVEELANGLYRFTPAAGSEARYLIDASRLEYDNDSETGEIVATYQYAPGITAPIHFDQYDYETDDSKARYFLVDGEAIYFHDIGQLRSRDGQLYYDYWELSGAKMWITNGRMCGILCLYAKTAEGITGFIVDRHAEGLIVGKDEDKMGQNGSPTNELTLQQVRVPAENVIGLEGRGQVNALETLNVGRAGIAMSSMCQFPYLIQWCEDHVASHYGDTNTPAWIKWRLQRMVENRFIAESFSWAIIGRFEHKQTKSVRIESAIAKMVVSEMLQEMIETAEEIIGIASQTDEFLVEKRKRDARVLNIYEGTNEIQRFFILKDIAGDVSRLAQTPPTPTGYAGPEIVEFHNLQTNVRQMAKASLDFLGQQIWQNPNLQANCFLLAEAICWLAVTDATLGRIAWLCRLENSSDHDDLSEMIEIGRRAFVRCAIEVRNRLSRFEQELSHLKRGFYAQEIRTASLLFRKPHLPVTSSIIQKALSKNLRILVVMDTPQPGIPEPVVGNGNLFESYRVWGGADCSALENALRIQDRLGKQCHLDVISFGSSNGLALARELNSLPIDNITYLKTPSGREMAIDLVANGFSDLLQSRQPYDLILGGQNDSLTEEGVFAKQIAGLLGIEYTGVAESLTINSDGAVVMLTQLGTQLRTMPVSVTIPETIRLRKFSIDQFLKASEKSMTVLDWPRRTQQGTVTLERITKKVIAEATAQPKDLQPPEASAFFLTELFGANGQPRGSDREHQKSSMELHWEAVTQPFFQKKPSDYVLAILRSQSSSKLESNFQEILATAGWLAQRMNRTAGVLIIGESELTDMPPELGAFPVTMVVLKNASDPKICQKLIGKELRESLESVGNLVGPQWLEDALVNFGKTSRALRKFFRVHGLKERQSKIVVQTSRYTESIHAEEEIEIESTNLMLSVIPNMHLEPSFAGKENGETICHELWNASLESFYRSSDIKQLLSELKSDLGLVRLSDAEFIIDVGFGIGNRDGFDEVIVPLEQTLRQIGVKNLVIGGSRKVTEELHLLPNDRQIGQSGVSVNPRILLAIGVSGAPQHLNYIGDRAIILAFNHDPECPLMTLNQRQPTPRVYRVLGNLFETLPAFTKHLQSENGPSDNGSE